MIYGSACEADIPTIDLPGFVLAHAKSRGDKPALIDGRSGRALSYAELDLLVRSLAAGLAAHGFAQGDTFCICLPNVPEYAVAFHGVLAAGGRCTTANPLYTPRELARQLAETDAQMLLTAPPFVDVAREAAAQAGCQLCVIGEAQGAISFSALLGDPKAAPAVAIDPATDIAVILYSGGTTGLPKGVLLSHRNLIATMVLAQAVLAVTSDDVLLAALPFFHVYGLVVILNFGLLAGATVVAMPRFAYGDFVDLLECYRVTRGYVVPPIALALAKDPAVEGRDLSALRHMLSAAAPLAPEVAQACARRIGCPVTEGFGMTEMSAITHLVPPFGATRKPGSVGPAIPGVECRLVDPHTGEDARPGEPGELWMRGPKVMRGYLNNAPATAAMIDQDGWLHSGDIAVVDEQGWFTIVGRIKDMIKNKGYQVAPAELEAILITHPQVADCAVIGVADEEAGELPKAFVVPTGAELDPGSVIRFVTEQVAPYKRIRAVDIVDEIPKSPSGRILRRVLEERERVRTASGHA
ncbi:MAG: AMP-binding protein [Actinomycetota bacterium]|nr:AMP-binding protein [Actinomycetota bacterium]